MYLFIVAGTMLVFPLISLGLELLWAGTGQSLVPLLQKWFLFWALGVRLFGAGLRQVLQPTFTAKHIFEIDDPKALVVVQELGFANLAFGLLGLLSLFLPAWAVPGLLVGTVFYGLAGIQHVFQKKKNRTEGIAMISDLSAAGLFGALLVLSFLRP